MAFRSIIIQGAHGIVDVTLSKPGAVKKEPHVNVTKLRLGHLRLIGGCNVTTVIYMPCQAYWPFVKFIWLCVRDACSAVLTQLSMSCGMGA